VKIQSYLNRPSPFLRRLLGRNIEPDSVDESDLPEGILTVLSDSPQQALAAALRCRPFIYDQVAAIIGVSRDRARQLEIRAAANLRLPHRFRQLCRFMPGWQNALRLPPDDATSLLPGEPIPPEFMRGRHWQYKPQVRRAFEHALARWERLGESYGYRNDEGSLERKVRLERQKRFEAIFGLGNNAFTGKKKSQLAGNFQLCEMFLKVDGRPACHGCPVKEITGASRCKRTPLAEALRKSRLGPKDQDFQIAAGKMAAFMRDIWAKTSGLKKKFRLRPTTSAPLPRRGDRSTGLLPL
jgi:hypothetical protein